MKYFLVFYLLLLITRTFTVFFHELGHAIPAIIFTKQKVSIYIGSYGDPKKSFKFNIGLLEIWFKYNPFLWELGLCVPSAKEISINKQIVYTLTGPLTSSIIAIILCYFAVSYNFHTNVQIVLLSFLVSSIYDLYTNLIPRSTPIKLYDGSYVYNDGYALKQLFSYKKISNKYSDAIELFNLKRYADAAHEFDNLILNGLKDENIFRLAISAFIQIKNFKKSQELLDHFMTLGKLNSDDYSNAAYTYSQLNLHVNALELYDKSLSLNPNNIYSLNNKGYTLNLLNRFEEAISIFDKAIENDKTYAYSYNNRGLAKIKIGKIYEGLEDITISLKLDSNNSYGYRNLGIYHLDKGEYIQALELFQKAKELDNNTHMIEELIVQAKNKFVDL